MTIGRHMRTSRVFDQKDSCDAQHYLLAIGKFLVKTQVAYLPKN